MSMYGKMMSPRKVMASGKSGDGNFGVMDPHAGKRQILDTSGMNGELAEGSRGSGAMARKGGGMMQAGADHGMMPADKSRREGMA